MFSTTQPQSRLPSRGVDTTYKSHSFLMTDLSRPNPCPVILGDPAGGGRQSPDLRVNPTNPNEQDLTIVNIHLRRLGNNPNSVSPQLSRTGSGSERITMKMF